MDREREGEEEGQNRSTVGTREREMKRKVL